MTEITADPKSSLWPAPRPQRYVVDPVAFFIALIGAPILVTLPTFWMIIPLAALLMGGPLFLIVGGPLLLWHLGRHEPDTEKIVRLSLLAMLVVALIGIPCFVIANPSGGALETALIFATFGFLFAMLWSAAFAWLYRAFLSAFFKRGITSVSLPQS